MDGFTGNPDASFTPNSPEWAQEVWRSAGVPVTAANPERDRWKFLWKNACRRAEEWESAWAQMEAEHGALQQQLDAARAVMRRYENWFDGAPEDSWRLQRDMMAALDMQEAD